VVLVSEEQMLRAIEVLLLKTCVGGAGGGREHGGAATIHRGCGEHVALVVSGANISREVLKQALRNA